MVEYEIRPVHESDIVHIAANMRETDVREVLASGGHSPREALDYSVARSDWAVTGLADGEPVVIFGVGCVNMICRIGAPWLLGSDLVNAHGKQFLRYSVEWKLRMLRDYNILRNIVDDRNRVSKRWLSWLGFELGEPFRIGKDEIKFRLFEMRKDHVRNGFNGCRGSGKCCRANGAGLGGDTGGKL